MQYQLDLIENQKKNLAREFGDCMTAQGLSKLLEKAEIMMHSLFTMFGEDNTNNRISIIINPEKFDPEIMMSIEDDWNKYVTESLGLEPADAIMITPF